MVLSGSIASWVYVVGYSGSPSGKQGGVIGQSMQSKPTSTVADVQQDEQRLKRGAATYFGHAAEQSAVTSRIGRLIL